MMIASGNSSGGLWWSVTITSTLKLLANFISEILGVRNGNTLYLNQLDGFKDNNYLSLLKGISNEIIKTTKESPEPIEFILIVENDLVTNPNGLVIDRTICPIINYPINTSFKDYEDFKDNINLINEGELYTNYDDNITTLLANSNIIDKNNFKYYDPQSIYYRQRNNVIKLSNNIGEDYLNKINTIIYLYKLNNPDQNIDDISLKIVDSIYLGDDFVLFVTLKGNIVKYILNYDDRVNKEIDLILSSLKEKNK